MKKTILMTGATDGIGLATAEHLVSMGHHVLLHGRNPSKLQNVEARLAKLLGDQRGAKSDVSPDAGQVQSYVADLSVMSDVESLAQEVIQHHSRLDVLINNAGVYRTSRPLTATGLDVRFAVNTIAPWLLTQRLLPLMSNAVRIVNLSSAAQSSVDLQALAGKSRLGEGQAYAQSKLALTMWSRFLAEKLGTSGPAVIAVNPGSLLASKMVKEAFGVAGKDIQIGADILVRAATDAEFASASGKYFDNDSGQFASPHADAMDQNKCAMVVEAIETVLATS